MFDFISLITLLLCSIPSHFSHKHLLLSRVELDEIKNINGFLNLY